MADVQDRDQERRRREEELRQMLLAQDDDDDDEPLNEQPLDNANAADIPIHNNGLDQAEDLQGILEQQRQPISRRISYVQASFGAAFALLYYALRTRQQWYLALVFLSSSKWAYIILGNALVAFCISIFFGFCNFFLSGLRLPEAEGLGDFFRWNITDTCLALTMFRSELDLKTCVLFLGLVLNKCLHWVVKQRESHLRMTEDAIEPNGTSPWPRLQKRHFQLLMALVVLQAVDMYVVVQCATSIFKNGPSVAILFAFEGAISLATVVSMTMLWNLHVMDGLLNHIHEHTPQGSFFHRWIHPWKDMRATFVFAVEVQAQAAAFVFYLVFFATVLTYYGMPINLIREVYMSFQALRQRLSAFHKYRQLMNSMSQFEAPSQDELEEAGTTCIICRDEMAVSTSKKLPGCGHLFHRSCLREWLVQQQTCPTCRGDISTMQARQRVQEAAQARQDEQQQQQQQEAEHHSVDSDQELEIPTPPDEPPEGEWIQEPPREWAELQRRQSPHAAEEPSRPKTVQELAEEQAQRMRDAALELAAKEQEQERSFMSVARTRRFEKASAGPETTGEDTSSPRSREPSPTFPRPLFEPTEWPILYRVSNDGGAAVYENPTNMSPTTRIRVVPFGVILLAKECSWGHRPGETELCMMLKVPDGWVQGNDVEHVAALPTSLEE